MKIYEHSNIQDVLRSYIEEQKALGKKITYQELAVKMRVQKSYLSKVMKRDAYLNKDQAYLLGKELGLDDQERDFLFLLIDKEKAAISEFKQELLTKIKIIQNKNTKSENYIDVKESKLSTSEIQKYYLKVENQLIHISLGIEKFQKNVELLKNTFNISTEQLNESLNILNNLGFIKIKDKQITLLKSNIHIPKDSDFFYNWQTLLKLKSQEHLKKISSDDKYNFLATFSADEEDQKKIRLEFMKYLKRVEVIVKKAKAKDLYQMSFDLFKWT